MTKTIPTKITFGLWFTYIIAIIAVFLLQHHVHTETFHYLDACKHWLARKNIYNGKGTDFIYLPTSAVIYIPFVYIHNPFNEILWRIINTSVFVFGLYKFSMLASEEKRSVVFFISSLICFGLGFDSIRNGQMNCMIAGLMLLSMSTLNEEKWSLSGFLLSLAIAVKPTAIVMWLLAFCLFPKVRSKLLFWFAILLLVPFLTAPLGYVLSQYKDAVLMLTQASQLGSTTPWAQWFGFLNQFCNVLVPAKIQYMIRLVMAVFTLGLCWKIFNTLPRKKAFIFLYALAASYLMLFNPRTENNDYIILAPSIGFFLSHLYYLNTNWKWAYIIIGGFSWLAMVLNYNLSALITPGRIIWLDPMMAMFFFIVTTAFVFHELGKHREMKIALLNSK